MTNPAFANETAQLSPVSILMDKCEQLLEQHRAANADLYRLVELKKESAAHTIPTEDNTATTVSTQDENPEPLVTELRGAQLRAQIQESHAEIRQRLSTLNANIIPRTQAHNRKSAHQSPEEERDFRADAVAAQIKTWRSLLPKLIRDFAKIPDCRRPNSVQHKMTVLMVFGLFAFIFRLSSRREMNRELTGPVIFAHLKKLFPELDSIPHADTLARALAEVNPQRIEAIHINLVKSLIRKKKFKKLLIQDCLPIAVDGSQKLYRQGLLQDDMWCERKVGNADSEDKQQYIYVLEANITLKTGLTIPLMTEYLYRSNNELERDGDKQDSETTAFERLAERLKKYFPRLKIMLLMDAMFATQPVMSTLQSNRWEYLICLPKRKLTDFAKYLNKNKPAKISFAQSTVLSKKKTVILLGE